MSSERKSASELWEASQDEIRKIVSETQYNQFVELMKPVSLEENVFMIGVTSGGEFMADWLSNSYSEVLAESIGNAAGEKISVKFIALEEEKTAPEKKPASKSEKTNVRKTSEVSAEPPPLSARTSCPSVSADPVQTFSLDPERIRAIDNEVCGVRPDFTFENYIVGEENRYAFSAAMTAAQNQGVYNPLYIYGSTGMGKTHLIQSVANYVRSHNPNAIVRYVTCEAFLNAYLDSLHNKSKFHSHFEFRNYFREVDLLLIDDVHQLAGKEQLQEEFFNTFNTLHNLNKQIILTSDKRPSEIPGLEARLVSRFESGLTTQITAPTFETRLSILQHAQKIQSVKFSSDILQYVAERVSSSIRSLKAALLRLVAYASLTQSGGVSISQAEELLGDMLDKEAENAKVSIESIQKAVAEHFGIRVPDILGAKRPKNIAEPRMIAMYLSRQMTDHSLVEIGAAFGGRNHATVLHAVNQVTGNAEADEEFRRTLSVLKRKIKS